MRTIGRISRAAGALAATAVAVGAVVATSSMRVPASRPGVARLRLSWSARPERIEVCRTASAEDLARLGEHMRQQVICDGRFATYLLRVEADGRALDSSVQRGAGLRHDRPLYLLRDYDLAGGTHRIRVSFTRIERTGADSSAASSAAESDTGLPADRVQREAVERSRRAHAAMPPRLLLDTLLSFTPGRVVLVTFDQDRRSLGVLDGAHSPP